MQTHHDSDANYRPDPIPKEFMDKLTKRAAEIRELEKSNISYGAKDEPVVMEWEAANGVHIRQMPDDPQGILRISIGGGDHLPVVVNYCTFRGGRKRCVELLRKALAALHDGPGTELTN